jgi:hypothetical protein
MVSRETVSEQLMYEIGDPTSYITPDCIADFSTIQLDDLGNDRVRVHGIKGRPNTPTLKVSASYLDGYVAFGSLTYSAPDAYEKARAADVVLRRADRDTRPLGDGADGGRVEALLGEQRSGGGGDARARRGAPQLAE